LKVSIYTSPVAGELGATVGAVGTEALLNEDTTPKDVFTPLPPPPPTG